MNPNKVTDNRFNSYFQFIRPSRQQQQQQEQEQIVQSSPKNKNNKNNNHLHIDTDPLGISYNNNNNNNNKDPTGQHQDEYYSDIFRNLNYPHDKPRSSSKQQQQQQHHHHENNNNNNNQQQQQRRRRRRSSCNQQQLNPPSLSPSPSPSSSSSSTAASPTYGPLLPSPILKRDIPHSKCQIRKGSFTSPTGSINAKSWEHMKSPAASFLSSFASPVLPPPYEEDGDEIDDYVFDKVIGQGGFSTVRSGYSISDGHKVAVKIIKKSCLNDQTQSRLDRELDIWKSLDHPNLVLIEKILETDHAMYIVCNYCGGGSLLDRVNKKRLNEQEARTVVIQICHALHYLHQEARVCHKDLKLENILLDDSNHVKICDFGLAIYQAPSMFEEVAGGSLAYAAPEQIRSTKPLPSPATDLWSLGVVLYALVTGRLPFQDCYDVRLQQKILDGKFEILPEDNLSDGLKDILHGLLQVDPRKRYTIQQVLHSSWCST